MACVSLSSFARLEQYYRGLPLVRTIKICPFFQETFDYFYNMCGEENVKCAGAWKKSESEAGACFTSRNCSKALAMEDTDDGQVFHLLATDDVQYVALGFSKDAGMVSNTCDSNIGICT